MSSRRARRLYSVATLVCLALLGAAPVGNAASGVRLDLGAIQVDEALLPGGSYQLPVIGVGNPGDEAAAYRMDVVALDGMAGQPIPAAWIRFEPQRFTLEAGGHVAVRARIVIPADAPPGPFGSLIVASTEPRPSTGMAPLGAASAARLAFTVEARPGLESMLRAIANVLDGLMPWPAIVGGLLVAGGVAGLLGRRFRVHVGIERRG